jgi:hypothetical protein
MTPEQQALLRSAARANEACAQPLVDRDLVELARILSSGRTRASAREIGNGTVLEVLGIVAGNKLLDHIQSAPELRYVKPLLEQGRLMIGSPVVQAALQSFVALEDVLTQADADKLCALGVEPNPLTPQEIADALYNADGTEK